MSALSDGAPESILVLNRKARNGGAHATHLTEGLKRLGSLQVYYNDQSGDAEKAIRQWAGPRTRVVIGGGDGTLHRLLPAVLEARATLGVLPLGTANDFVRSIGVPLDPFEALAVIVQGHVRHVDVGRVNDTLFLNALGVGLGPSMTKELKEEAKARLGTMAYLISTFKAISRQESFRIRLDIDGNHHSHRCVQVTIANGINYGAGMRIVDSAAIDDGQLDVVCVRAQKLWRWALSFLALRSGRTAANPGLRTYRGAKVKLSTRRPRPVTADGEFVTRTPLSCSVQVGVLPVYAPPNNSNG